jgi:hypothetical protein
MFSEKNRPVTSSLGFSAETDHAKGGSMSKHKDKSGTVPVVGASGAIGILPDGYFAKILSDPAQESSSADSQSSQDAAQHS